MSGTEISITCMAVALIGFGVIDLIYLRRWIKFDRTPASWWRLLIHDFAVYALLIFFGVTVFAVSNGGDFLQTVQNFNWLITVANIFLAIIFRWFVTGKFRRPKDSDAAANQTDSNPASK